MRRNDKSGATNVWAVCLGCTALAGSSLAQEPPRPDASSPDVVVEGRRDDRRLQGGQWMLRLSPSYLYGRVPELGSGERVMGRDRSWKFCLKDTDVEPLARMLIGEGQLQSSGTATCSRLKIRLGDGKLAANQSCSGITMQVKSKGTGTGTGTASTVTAAQDMLRITGRYDSVTLNIDFNSQTAPVGFDPSYAMRPEGRHWSIRGQRLGECVPS